MPSPHNRITGMRAAVSRRLAAVESRWEPGPGTTTGDGSGEGLAIDQPGARKQNSRLMVEIRTPND